MKYIKLFDIIENSETAQITGKKRRYSDKFGELELNTRNTTQASLSVFFDHEQAEAREYQKQLAIRIKYVVKCLWEECYG